MGIKTLHAIHNLSSRNLLHANVLGGLACPSFAVISNDIAGIDAYGEITLVSDAALVNPRKVGVYDADIYSSRSPRCYYEISKKSLDSILETMSDSLADGGDDHAEKRKIMSNLEDDGINGLLNTSQYLTGLALAFVREQGRNPRIPKEEHKMSLPFSDDKEVMKIVKNNDLSSTGFDHQVQVDLGKKIFSLLEDKASAMASNININDKSDDFKADYEGFLDKYVKRFLIEKDGNLIPSPSTVSKLIYDYQKLISKSKPTDCRKLSDNLKPYILKNTIKYHEWIREKFSGAISNRFMYKETANGYRKKIPYNLENCVKEMKGKVRDGEGFSYGPGCVRALIARQFRSYSEMESHMHRLVSATEFEAVKEVSNNAFFNLTEVLAPAYKNDSNKFGYLDDVIDSLKDYHQKGVSSLDNYYEPLSPEQKGAIDEYMTSLRDMKTGYFEAKFNRAVYISEFKAAIIPNYLVKNKEVMDILKNAGLKIVKYNPEIEGSRTNAFEKIKELAFCEIITEDKKINKVRENSFSI